MVVPKGLHVPLLEAESPPRKLAQMVALPRPESRALAAEVAAEPLLWGTDELFRGIYTRAGVTLGSDVLAVCSAISGEGKTTLSLGLAVTIAEDFPEARVLLVETDLERAVLARDFGLERSPGLVDCLLRRQPFHLAARSTQLANLDLVPAGEPSGSSGRLVRSARMATCIDETRQSYDLVILDTPAVLVNSDALVLADLADAVIVVVRAAVTPAPLVNKALQQLDDAKLRGVVLNDSRAATPGWLRRIFGL